MKKKYWIGDMPELDDFGIKIKNVVIDGRTKLGPWAMMTPETFKNFGVGLGLGFGQKYKKQKDGKWLKIEG